MLKIFHKKFGDSYKTITFVADIRIFSCLFVKFVLYTSGVPWGGSSAFLFILCLSSQGVMGQCLFTEEPPLHIELSVAVPVKSIVLPPDREHSIVPSELNPARLPPDREP